MRTAIIEGKRVKVTYRANSGMSSEASFEGKQYYSMTCHIYNVVDDKKHLVLVLVNTRSVEIPRSTTVITVTKYLELLNMSSGSRRELYHNSLLEICGAII